MKQEFTEVVEDGVMRTFSEMFGQSMHATPRTDVPDCDRKEFVRTGVSFAQDGVYTDFVFNFEQALLRKASRKIYPKDSAEALFALEDMACEITNIVGSKVKAVLNKNGYNIEMAFPFVNRDESDCPAANDPQGTTHISFFYNENKNPNHLGVAVDFLLLETA